MRWLKGLLLLSACVFMSTAVLAVQRLPVEAFASAPDVQQLRLSPSGHRLLYLKRITDSDHSGTLVNVYDIKTGQVSALVESDDEEYRVRWVDWANDSLLLIGIAFPSKWYGVDTLETRLLKYDLNTNKLESAAKES